MVAAPAVFDQGDDDGLGVLLREHPPPELRADVEQAVLLCPAGAITLREDTRRENTRRENDDTPGNPGQPTRPETVR